MVVALKEKVIRWFTVLAVLAIAIGGLMFVYPSYQRSCMLRNQEAELQERIEAKKREIAQLIDNQRRFRTDADFVEAIARQNRRVFPGELVFIFEN